MAAKLSAPYNLSKRVFSDSAQLAKLIVGKVIYS